MSQSSSLNTFTGKLARFPGAYAQDEAIGEIGLGADDFAMGGTTVEADSYSYLAYSVWCVCFHLYSGLGQFCFQVLETEQQRVTADVKLGVCIDIGPIDTLHSVKDRIAIRTRQFEIDGQDRLDIIASGSNTAVHFVPTRPVAAYLDGQLPRQVDMLLRVGFDQTDPPNGYIGISSWNLIYRRSFISDQEAKGLAATVEHVARTLLRNPTCKIAQLGISPRDWDALSTWNKVKQHMERRDQLVHHAFAAAARAHRQELAVAAWDGQMNYRELDEASSALAEHLVTSESLSNRSNRWVALCFGKSRWAIVAMLAVLKAGCACVFLDPSYPDHRLRHILKATRTRIVLTSTGDETLVVRLLGLDMGDEGPVTLHKVPCVDVASPAYRVDVESSSSEPRLRRDSGVEVVGVTSPADAAFAIFTQVYPISVSTHSYDA